MENKPMSLGDRMKAYENVNRLYLPKNSYNIIRLDGKAFHTFTKKFEKPFDETLIGAMDAAAISLCESIQGAKFAYVQSDEISILLTDVENEKAQLWFNGNVQKITSVSASNATKAFNKYILSQKLSNLDPYDEECSQQGYYNYIDEIIDDSWAEFDSRVFTVPNKIEAYNAFLWRQQDWKRNSVSMTAQTEFSHKQLHGKNTAVVKEMLLDKGINWDEFEQKLRLGRLIFKENYTLSTDHGNVLRSRWKSVGAEDFTEYRDEFLSMIPEHFENIQ